MNHQARWLAVGLAFAVAVCAGCGRKAQENDATPPATPEAKAEPNAAESPLNEPAQPDGARENSLVALAAKQGQVEQMRSMLAQNASPNQPSLAGNTPLQAAALNGNRAAVELLISNGAEIDARARGGFTALHFACLPPADGKPDGGARKEIARLLIEKRADVNARSDDGRTPLHVAAKWGRTDIAALLLQYGADPQGKTTAGITPRQLAETAGNEEILRLFSK